MGKLLLVLSLICLIILSLGTVMAPQSSAFWLASGTTMYQHIREVLMLVLILQLVTQPPRHVWLRLLSGAIAGAVGVWSVEAIFAGNMLFLDSLCFMAASLAIMVTALERKVHILVAVSANNKVLA
jgi:hypothetical protein